MGRKVNPIGFRLKINKTWEGRWFAEGEEYVNNLHQDFHLRESRIVAMSFCEPRSW